MTSYIPDDINEEDLEETLATSYMLVDWTREDLDVTWTETLCDLTSTEAHDTQTYFPDAFIDTMPIRERTATLSAAEVGAAFISDSFLSLNGVELDDPWSDSLPTSTGDSRVFDQDEDGEVGVTVNVDAGLVEGDIYLVQRTKYEIDGLVTAQDRVEGYVWFEDEQSILDATSSMFTIVDVETQTNPDETASYAVFQEIDPGWNCIDILDAGDGLFSN